MHTGLLTVAARLLALTMVSLALGCAHPISASTGAESQGVWDVALDTPSWSPDGRWVVIDGRNPPGLIVISHETGEVRRLTKSPYHNDPTWSPVANTIAYVDKEAAGLWIIEDVFGTPASRQVVKDRLELYKDCWSPDGSWVVFWREKDLSLVNPQTGRVRRLLSSAGLLEMASPRWSANGQRIVASRFPQTIVEISVSDGVIEPIAGIRGGLFSIGPNESVWGRDVAASQVLFRRDPKGQVERVNLGGDIRAIDVDQVSGDALASVNGKGVARVDRSTLEPTWITTGRSEGPASWSPDGCVIAVVRKKGPRAGLFFVNAGGGLERCR